MNATMNRKPRWCWRKDLAEFRGLTERERAGFLLVLEWFENFRLRLELEAGRKAAVHFWKSEVMREGREREKWSGVVALCRDKHRQKWRFEKARPE